MSKGSNARPFAVDRDTFASNFDAIFKKRTPEERAKDELGPRVNYAVPYDPSNPLGLTNSKPNPTRMWMLDAQGNSVETETDEAIRLGTVGSTTSHADVFGKSRAK